MMTRIKLPTTKLPTIVTALAVLAALLFTAPVFTAPASAQTDSDRRDQPSVTDTRPVDVEALTMRCRARQIRSDQGPIKAVHCEWRPATHPHATGYQLWRIVGLGDGAGQRELVWRGGLDAVSNTSRVPADAGVATYALLAVDRNGEIVGRSRPQVVRLGHPSR